MLRLHPVCKQYLWGGNKLSARFHLTEPVAESWELSVHPDGESLLDSGEPLSSYLADHVGAVDAANSPLPVLIKLIDAARDLSVQVHPDDAYARLHEQDNGKTELWYIVQADEGAGIYLGFRTAVTKEEVKESVKKGTVCDLLNFIPVKAGDHFLVPAGTVHAIGKGCLICEIQQSSNVTYRLYDYKRKGADGKLRPLHLKQALDVLDCSALSPRVDRGESCPVEGGEISLLTDCKKFRVRELSLCGTYTEANPLSFTAVTVLSGEGTADGEAFSVGDTFFVPRGESFTLKGEGKLLLTDVPKKYFAGIDLGGTAVKCGIVDEDGRLLGKDSFPTKRERPYDEIAADMATCIRSLEKKFGVKIQAAGIGSPGTVDSANGVIVYSNNIAWKNVPLGKAVSSRLGVPVFVTNDANAAALGECRCGAGSSYKNALFITLGTGVGGGIVLDGKLYEGNRSAGAELGHTVLRVGGEKCTCGRRGCFEAYASATALIRQTVFAMKHHPESELWKLCGGDVKNVNGKTAFDGLALKDKTATAVVKKYIRYLAEGLANLANIFRPEIILLGGGVCGAGDVLLKPLKKTMDRLLYGGVKYAPVGLAIASLGNDAGLFGAAMFASDNVKK